MRALILSCVVLCGAGFLAHAQDQTLRGVFAPPGAAAPASKSGTSTLSAPDFGAIGSGPRVTIFGAATQGQTLPSNVSPAPIPDRPGYGKAIVNGHRVIVDLTNNRIIRVVD